MLLNGLSCKTCIPRAPCRRLVSWSCWPCLLVTRLGTNTCCLCDLSWSSGCTCGSSLGTAFCGGPMSRNMRMAPFVQAAAEVIAVFAAEPSATRWAYRCSRFGSWLARRCTAAWQPSQLMPLQLRSLGLVACCHLRSLLIGGSIDSLCNMNGMRHEETMFYLSQNGQRYAATLARPVAARAATVHWEQPSELL